MPLKDILAAPQLYQAFQRSGGFFQARLKAIARHLPIKSGDRVIDIGCGPGHIVKYLPGGIRYTGFDVDQRYIDFANKHFGARGDFHCRFFDAAAAAEFGPADIVMMNGVLHHIPEPDAKATLAVIAKTLKPSGTLFTLDGVFHEGQSSIARMLLKNDRGEFVRTEQKHLALMDGIFPFVTHAVRDDLCWVPYSLIVVCARKSQLPASVPAAA